MLAVGEGLCLHRLEEYCKNIALGKSTRFGSKMQVRYRKKGRKVTFLPDTQLDLTTALLGRGLFRNPRTKRALKLRQDPLADSRTGPEHLLAGALRRSLPVIGIFLSSAAYAQNAADARCTSFIQMLGQSNDEAAICGRIGELRSICSQGTMDSSDLNTVISQLTSTCSTLGNKPDAQPTPTRPAAPLSNPAPVTSRPSVPVAPLPATPLQTNTRQAVGGRSTINTTVSKDPAVLAANRQQVMESISATLLLSLARTQATVASIQALVAIGSMLGETYFERKKGSVLEYSSETDDAIADARGYRKRESADFVVYYKTGDIERAKKLLDDAADSVPPIAAVLHHFPSVAENHGRKLPIYLAQTKGEYLNFSECPSISIACVKHTIFDDGFVSTMYVSPDSYSGTNADERLRNFRETTQHELTHYAQFDMLTGETARTIPSWFVEGLATYVAGEGPSRVGILKMNQARGRLLPMSELENPGGDIYKRTDVNLFYAEGFTVFEMIVATQGAEKATTLIVDVTQHESFSRGVQTMLGLSPAEFDSHWRRYVSEHYHVAIPASKFSSQAGIASSNMQGTSSNMGGSPSTTGSRTSDIPTAADPSLLGCWHRESGTAISSDGHRQELGRYCAVQISETEMDTKCGYTGANQFAESTYSYTVSSAGVYVAELVRQTANPTSAARNRTAHYQIDGDTLRETVVDAADGPNPPAREESIWVKDTIPPPPAFAGCKPH
jgi:hypothetical protein